MHCFGQTMTAADNDTYNLIAMGMATILVVAILFNIYPVRK